MTRYVIFGLMPFAELTAACCEVPVAPFSGLQLVRQRFRLKLKNCGKPLVWHSREFNDLTFSFYFLSSFSFYLQFT